MVRSCPTCGRPNREGAARCLYCAKPLPEAPPAKTAPAKPAAAAPPAPPRRHLIVLAPQAVPPERVEALGRIAGLSLYQARLALQMRRHHLLKKVETESEARVLASALHKAGIAHFMVPEAEIERVPIASLRGLRFAVEHLVLEVAEEREIRVAYGDLLLLVRGEIVRERVQERRLASTRGASQRLTPGYRLHFYPRHPPGGAELDPEHFDWRGLGEPLSSSTPINLNRLIEKIRSRAPTAELDEGFAWETAVLSPSQSSSDLDSVLAGGEKAREGELYDNEAQFRYYARWRYLAALAGREAAAERLG